MKFHFASFLITISAGVQATSLRGSSADEDNTTTATINKLRALQSAEILDLEEFIRSRASGTIGNRLLPSRSTFEYLDTDSFTARLRDDTMEIGLLNLQEQTPLSIDRLTCDNAGFQEQACDIVLRGSTAREFSASVTAGFRYQQTIEASVGFKGIADVSTSAEFEFSLETTIATTASVTEEFERPISLITPPYSRISATQLVSNIVSNPSFTIDIEIIGNTQSRECNPGVFDNKRWACEANRFIATGNRCSSGWQLCDDIQGHCNPGLFDNQRWHCDADPSRYTGNSCSSGWNPCNDDSHDDPALCYYYRDSQGKRSYMCSSISEIFLQGQSDHDFDFRQTGTTIRYQAQGEFTGVGGRDVLIDLDYECLSPFVLDSDGLCIPPSEFESNNEPPVASLVISEPYRKERLVLDESGNIAERYDMMN